MKKLIISTICFISFLSSSGQNVAINNNSAPPDASAILDISSNSKGMLIPRMRQDQRNAINKPARGLLVYQTNIDSGFYFNSGDENNVKWIFIQSQLTGWGTKGNSGTNPSINFIGTTDANALRFRYNNINAGLIDSVTFNTGIGFRSFDSITTGRDNTALGYKSLVNMTDGNLNVAVGSNALPSSKSGISNVAIGYTSLFSNGDGWENTAIGAQSLKSNLEGNDNTAVGAAALFSINSGAANTALGAYASAGLVSGSYNTALGASATVSHNNFAATAVGAGAIANCDYCLVLGSYSPPIHVGISRADPSFPLSFSDILGDKISLWGGAPNHYGFGIQSELLQVHTDQVSSDIAFGYGRSESFNETMRIKGNGNVGIGTFTPTARLSVAEGSVLFTGPASLPGIGSIPISGSGSRTMWYAAKAAFRSGTVDNNNWDKDSIGINSVAFGNDSKAKGENSFASGWNTSASGYGSTALGHGTTATGSGATAMGVHTIASGDHSTAMGSETKAIGAYSTAMGYFSTAVADFSTVMGGETIASGYFATAMGSKTTASGIYSMSAGYHTVAKAYGSLTIGEFNDDLDNPPESSTPSDRIFQIGNGTYPTFKSNALTVLRNGNVGIGVTLPATSLHIKDGNSGFAGAYQAGLVFEGDGHRYLNFITPDANESGVFFGRASRIDHGGIVYNNFITPNGLQFRTNGNITKMVITANGNVGIGTTSPGFPLNFSNASGDKISLWGDNGIHYGFGIQTALMQIYTDGAGADIAFGYGSSGAFTENMRIKGTGNVGIGTTTPAQKLHVVGNICATGTIGSCSDIRYKTNLSPITNILPSVLGLQGLYYDWKKEEFPDMQFSSDRQIGFSAQEMEKIFPEVVATDSKGYKSIDYGKLTPVLVEAIKEQQQQIKLQRDQIEQLNKKNESMEKKFAELKNLVAEMIQNATKK